MRVLVVNGPNLNLLGTRRPDVYGTTTLGELEDMCRQWGTALGCEVSVFQSNHEGALVDAAARQIWFRASGTYAGPDHWREPPCRQSHFSEPGEKWVIA